MRTSYQMRAMPTKFRAEELENEKYIEGYFAVFGSNYQIFDGATEDIDPHAFDNALDDDIRALINHDSTLILGRTKSKTLTLKIDKIGLWGRIKINPADTDAMNLYARVQRGDVDQCSFGFDILEETADWREDGSVHWHIIRVKLFEVSPVTFPAYEETTVQARKNEVKTQQKRRDDIWREKMKARFKNGTASTDDHKKNGRFKAEFRGNRKKN